MKNEGLDKKIILFVFNKGIEDNDTKSDYFKKIMINVLDIVEIIHISEYDSFVNIISLKKYKIDKNKFLICLFGDSRTDQNLAKALTLLLRKDTHFRFLSIEDQKVFNKAFYNDYLTRKGVDLSLPVIHIREFKFDNFLCDDFQGIFVCGDLLLPSLFGDYTMILEGADEYGDVRINKGDTVFDCGAHIGSFTALALCKGAYVHSFEPNKDTFCLLTNNLRHYDKSRMFLNNIGLSDNKGVMDFCIKSDSYAMPGSFYKTEKRPVITIDDYVKENNLTKVDFIKADIEGAERDMLIGAMETIKKFKPKLVISINHLADDRQVIEDIILNTCSDYDITHKWFKCYALAKNNEKF